MTLAQALQIFQIKNITSLYALSDTELKKKYHKLIKQYHPDVCKVTSAEIGFTVEQLKGITEQIIQAYEMLDQYKKNPSIHRGQSFNYRKSVQKTRSADHQTGVAWIPPASTTVSRDYIILSLADLINVHKGNRIPVQSVKNRTPKKISLYNLYEGLTFIKFTGILRDLRTGGQFQFTSHCELNQTNIYHVNLQLEQEASLLTFPCQLLFCDTVRTVNRGQMVGFRFYPNIKVYLYLG